MCYYIYYYFFVSFSRDRPWLPNKFKILTDVKRQLKKSYMVISKTPEENVLIAYATLHNYRYLPIS